MPPRVQFTTIPFHPNIDAESGVPSLDCLTDAAKWRDHRHRHTLKSVLRALQHLLANPLLDRAVNMDAVFMFKDQPKQYDFVVRQCVLASQQIANNGLTEHGPPTTFRLNNMAASSGVSNALASTSSRSRSSQAKADAAVAATAAAAVAAKEATRAQHRQQRRREETSLSSTSSALAKAIAAQRKHISFDDYCMYWHEMATSKCDDQRRQLYINASANGNANTKSKKGSTSAFVIGMSGKQQPALFHGSGGGDSAATAASFGTLAKQLSTLSAAKDLEKEVLKRLADHKGLVYGHFDFGGGAKPIKNLLFHDLMNMSKATSNGGADSSLLIKRSDSKNIISACLSSSATQLQLKQQQSNQRLLPHQQPHQQQLDEPPQRLNSVKKNVSLQENDDEPIDLDFRITSASSVANRRSLSGGSRRHGEPMDAEVDELINWTSNLQ